MKVLRYLPLMLLMSLSLHATDKSATAGVPDASGAPVPAAEAKKGFFAANHDLLLMAGSTATLAAANEYLPWWKDQLAAQDAAFYGLALGVAKNLLSDEPFNGLDTLKDAGTIGVSYYAGNHPLLLNQMRRVPVLRQLASDSRGARLLRGVAVWFAANQARGAAEEWYNSRK